MPSTPLRNTLLTLAALLAVALAACEPAAGDGAQAPEPLTPPPIEGTPEPLDLPECEYPEEVRMPKWLPDDLPLPEGTYAMERLEELAGYRRVLMVSPVTIDVLTDHSLEVWPDEGWVLGRGDAEPGEIEVQFSKAPRVGALRAQSVFCDPGFTMVYLILAEDRPDLPAPGIPSPRGSPLVPSAPED